VSDQFGDCARPAFRLRGLLVGVNAQCVSCFEGRCFSGESGNRAYNGFSLPACSIWAGFPPPKNPNIWSALPLFALHTSLLIPRTPVHEFSSPGGNGWRCHRYPWLIPGV
jgi:hypothetical protein